MCLYLYYRESRDGVSCKELLKLSNYRPLGLQEVEVCRISRQLSRKGCKVVSPRHWPPIHPGDIPGTDFCERLCQPQSHNAARRIKSMKNPEDPIGNQTHDLTACSTMPQSTATLRVKVI